MGGAVPCGPVVAGMLGGRGGGTGTVSAIGTGLLGGGGGCRTPLPAGTPEIAAGEAVLPRLPLGPIWSGTCTMLGGGGGCTGMVSATGTGLLGGGGGCRTPLPAGTPEIVDGGGGAKAGAGTLPSWHYLPALLCGAPL